MTDYCINCQTKYDSPDQTYCSNCGKPRNIEADAEESASLQNHHTMVLKTGSGFKAIAKSLSDKVASVVTGPVAASTESGTIQPAIAPAENVTKVESNVTSSNPNLDLEDSTTAKLNDNETVSPALSDATTAKLNSDSENLTVPANNEEAATDPVIPLVAVAAPETSAAPAWTCPQCQHQNPASAEYCDECGAMYVAPGEQAEKPAISHAPTPFYVTNFRQRSINIEDGVKLGWRLQSGSNTNEGVARQGHADEDSVFVLELRRFFEARPESFGVYIVADGMGGQAAGEVASRNTIEKISQILMQSLALPWLSNQPLSQFEIESTVKQAVLAGHYEVYNWNVEHSKDSGSTLTMVCIINEKAVFANVGDSRTYLFRRGGEELLSEPKTVKLDPSDAVSPPSIEYGRRTTDKLKYKGEVRNSELTRAAEDVEEQLLKVSAQATKPYEAIRVTRDQSLVQQLVDAGVITDDDVYTDPRRNMVLNGMGANSGEIPVDIYYRDLIPGDRVLLCSDGLWEMVRDPQIGQVLTENLEPQQAVDSLIKLACVNGGADNVSVIVVAVSN